MIQKVVDFRRFLYPFSVNKQPNKPARSPGSTGSRQALWQALNIAWELGYMIALPLVLFALAGRWIDKHYDTSPWFLLGGMALAILLTTLLLIRKFSRLLRDMNPAEKK